MRHSATGESRAKRSYFLTFPVNSIIFSSCSRVDAPLSIHSYLKTGVSLSIIKQRYIQCSIYQQDNCNFLIRVVVKEPCTILLQLLLIGFDCQLKLYQDCEPIRNHKAWYCNSNQEACLMALNLCEEVWGHGCMRWL